MQHGFKTLKTRLAHDGHWLSLSLDRVRMPSGQIIENFHVVKFRQEAAAAIVTDAKNRLLLIRSYRYPTRSVEWEIPAGGIDAAETPVQAARREVYEETGYITNRHKLVYSYHPITGVSPHRFHLVSCVSGKKVKAHDPHEVQAIRWFTRREVASMLRRGKIKDGFSLTGILFFLMRG